MATSPTLPVGRLQHGDEVLIRGRRCQVESARPLRSDPNRVRLELLDGRGSTSVVLSRSTRLRRAPLLDHPSGQTPRLVVDQLIGQLRGIADDLEARYGQVAS